VENGNSLIGWCWEELNKAFLAIILTIETKKQAVFRIGYVWDEP